ncbi:NUDIX hydrolase [Xinfangfangia sp. CPCC 101601]|uniref:NUDIX hydrolase n=1 Tax=Pseudogemmobacter lacusdianii TaxID=3069608 RepID=A0ABU0VV84_9RHOB|nr:NUDIX hydrolase [Xinfangfangia sp. CPCC 101601]MDQ2065664.1 NUDIX hydrolase [Xinfangfangia sp. CPCC 101601]
MSDLAAAPPIRAAATIVLTRRLPQGETQVLMGQRGAAAAFMPSKYVFPGGGVDPEDAFDGPLPLNGECARRLAQVAPPGPLVAAALRELQEETALALRADRPSMRFVFRAITPPGRSRRFDACFFLADAADVSGSLDHFDESLTELSHLHWIGLDAARALDLPFITEVVLAEVTNLIRGGTQPGVPFFDNSGPVPTFRRID